MIAIAKRGTYRTATDLDVLAVRSPYAGRIVPGGTAGRDEDHTVIDGALGVPIGEPDMLIGEVKEGRAELNAAASDSGVLRAVLVGFGCCPSSEAPLIAEDLLRDGHARLPNGHRIRTVVFASTPGTGASSNYLFVSLGHVVKFLRSYLDEHWEVLRHADPKDQAFAFLVTLTKAEREMPA